MVAVVWASPYSCCYRCIGIHLYGLVAADHEFLTLTRVVQWDPNMRSTTWFGSYLCGDTIAILASLVHRHSYLRHSHYCAAIQCSSLRWFTYFHFYLKIGNYCHCYSYFGITLWAAATGASPFNFMAWSPLNTSF